MGTGSIGSVPFWQQDQNYWTNVQAENQATSATSALISSMGNAMTAQARGIASIANQQALARVQAQLTDALKSAIAQTQAASASGSSSISPNGSPATGTGTVPVTASTSLTTLRIPPNTAFTVSDGTNTNTYTSTGTDTVGDLINGLNAVGPTAANVVTYLNSSGNIVVAGTNNTVSVSVGGTFASNIGFGAKNDLFSRSLPRRVLPALPRVRRAPRHRRQAAQALPPGCFKTPRLRSIHRRLYKPAARPRASSATARSLTSWPDAGAPQLAVLPS